MKVGRITNHQEKHKFTQLHDTATPALDKRSCSNKLCVFFLNVKHKTVCISVKGGKKHEGKMHSSCKRKSAAVEWRLFLSGLFSLAVFSKTSHYQVLYTVNIMSKQFSCNIISSKIIVPQSFATNATIQSEGYSCLLGYAVGCVGSILKPLFCCEVVHKLPQHSSVTQNFILTQVGLPVQSQTFPYTFYQMI